jgi:hypothetical protein
MSFLKELDHIKSDTAILSFLAVLLLVTPGTAFIFIYANKLFLELETIKLVLLSVSAISPFIVLNFFLSAIDDPKATSYQNLILSILLSGITIYFTLVGCYFFKKDIFSAIKIIGLIEIFILVNAIYESRKRRQNLLKEK